MGKIKDKEIDKKMEAINTLDPSIIEPVEKHKADIRIPLHQYAYIEIKAEDTMSNLKRIYDEAMDVFKQENVLKDVEDESMKPGTRQVKTASDFKYI